MPLEHNAEDWLTTARADVRAAQKCSADRDDELLLGLACFHCQQAAEKAAKGVLVARGVAFQKIHDIEALLDRAEEHGIVVSPVVRSARSLNEFIVDSRYPTDVLTVTGETLDAALSIAETVVAWAEVAIRSPELPLPR